MREQVALGFDGSTSEDWTGIRAETRAGHQFTPTFSGGKTIWNPANHGGRIPRAEVKAAFAHLFTTYDVARLYADPKDWWTELDELALEHGEDVVVVWPTNRITQMHAALERFVRDLIEGGFTHDDCPDTAEHMANARKSPRPGEKYIIQKPDGAYHQKIDLAVTSVLVHEAACDARAAGWPTKKTRGRMVVLR